MQLALVDEDTLYQSVFKEFFEEQDIDIVCFSYGWDFLNAPIEQLKKIKFIVIDHTLLDITVYNLVQEINQKISAEICIISTDGKALKSRELDGLGISGDFKTTELKQISSWHKYFRVNFEKELQCQL